MPSSASYGCPPSSSNSNHEQMCRLSGTSVSGPHRSQNLLTPDAASGMMALLPQGNRSRLWHGAATTESKALHVSPPVCVVEARISCRLA